MLGDTLEYRECRKQVFKFVCETRVQSNRNLQVVFDGFVFFRLTRYPTGRLVVEPDPPKDFKVFFNDQVSEISETGIYRAPSGIISVRVVRDGKTPCIWQGLVDGQKQIDCKL